VAVEPGGRSDTYYPEERHPVSRVLFAVYEPVCRFVLRWPKATIAAALAVMAATVPSTSASATSHAPPQTRARSSTCPRPSPGISVTEAARLLQVQDRILKAFPEVVSVHGKAGRAETSTDPRPFSMMETVVQLKPDSEWASEGALVLELGPEG